MHGINKLNPSEYFILFSVFFFFNLVSVSSQQKDNPESEIYLIVRGDDMEFCHATNMACIQSYQKGIIRSVEIMVPGPWFLDAVEMLKQNPGLDTPETQGILSLNKNPSDVFMAEYRAAVTEAITSDTVINLIRQKGIHLVSYGDIIK